MFGLFKKKIVTRFAPSPTGLLHLGNYRTALFSYLFARKNGGKFLLRIEDTDTERSRKEFEENILESLAWMGLSYDNDNKAIIRQSERKNVHKKYLENLLEKGSAYVSKETVTEPGQREEVIRFKNPKKKITFTDLIRGEVTFDTTELGDFIIAKSLDEPVFHLAVVVDDFDMGITHIIRGEDHISNTPRQILIQEAIGAPRPIYAHLPLILAPDKTKLSKRHGAKALTEYRDLGYLPEAMINYLAMLGWNPGTEQEIFTINELIKEFDISKVNKGGAVFNIEKLDWFNKEWLKINPKAIEEKVRAAFISNFIYNLDKDPLVIATRTSNLIPAVTERITKLSDIDALFNNGEFDFLKDLKEYDVQKVNWKDTPRNLTGECLAEVQNKISAITTEFPTALEVKNSLWKFAEEKGRGQVLWPLRYSLSGKDKSPDPFVLVSVLGKTESIKRIETAIKKLNAIQDK